MDFAKSDEIRAALTLHDLAPISSLTLTDKQLPCP